MEISTVIMLVLAYPFLAAWLVGLGRNSRIDLLEREIAALREQIEAIPTPPLEKQPAAQVHAEQAPAPTPEPVAEPEPEPHVPDWAAGEGRLPFWPVEPRTAADMSLPPQVEPDDAASQIADTRAGASQQKPEPVELQGPPRPPIPTMPGWASKAMGWLFTGNLVAKLGLVILFIGVGFLLKYVAETVYVPIEFRLAGVVAGTLALLSWGWRMRTARREIGLPIQGTAIAILMLTVFGAYYHYELIPASLAFAVLVALTAFTCLLAVLQDSPWLAAFGITGGFASPLLLSSGQGDHIGLFSYYALLNAGVFAIAIKRAWRPLNLIGFAFTFIVASAWGGLRYLPANYLSAQLFLGLFFLFYVGIAIAFARQQSTRLKDYVDATLVLGTPLLAFGLQVGLVKDKEYGIALSALALGLFYLSLGLILWRRGGERLRILLETFVVLGVVFGTLAIPFAVDGRWTSGVWALEGAGFAWFGLRRKQRLTWAFGVLLQAGAWIGFLGAAAGLNQDAARNANMWLGFLLLAGSAFAMARGFRRHAGEEDGGLRWLANFFIVLAAGWLLAGAWTEAILHTRGSLLANLLAAGAMFTAGLLYLSGARLAWPLARHLAAASQVAGACAMLVVSAAGWPGLVMAESDGGEPLTGVLMVALAALATSRMLQRAPDPDASKRFPLVFLLWGAAWWFGPAMGIAAGRFMFLLPEALGEIEARWSAMYALLVAASAVAASRLAQRLAWPQLRWLGAGSWGMHAIFSFFILIGLYGTRTLPEPGVWLAWAILWASGEYVLLRWTAAASLQGRLLAGVHAVRTAAPWLAIWPAGAILVGRWLAGPEAGLDAAQQVDWTTSAAWGNYLPSWAMMLVLAWLTKRSQLNTWPTAPLSVWYQRFMIPCGALLLLALAGVWNLIQDGAMAPLPYLPLLNPLDLTTGFALLLCAGAARRVVDGLGGKTSAARAVRIAGLLAAYTWFNLILLRSAAHYRGIPYRLEELAASQFVQSMLSLVWCASAMILMRFAARRTLRQSWCIGAVLLDVVVLKLFSVDLANSGSLARVISFVGVGLLMVLIGYFAPFPKSEKNPALVTQGV